MINSRFDYNFILKITISFAIKEQNVHRDLIFYVYIFLFVIKKYYLFYYRLNKVLSRIGIYFGIYLYTNGSIYMQAIEVL